MYADTLVMSRPACVRRSLLSVPSVYFRSLDHARANIEHADLQVFVFGKIFHEFDSRHVAVCIIQNKLVDAGLLRRLDIGPRMYYEHDYGYPQHEHMFCTSCHKVIEFQHPSMEAIINEVCQNENFQMEGHSFIVRGICADCNRKKMTKRRLDLV